MKSIQYLNNLNYKLQLEKLVVGVEEPIFIKGIGTVLSKVDSGNGSYNVLHGEDFYYQGNDIVIFTTFDENEKPHKLSKKIQDTITINIGAGHTEERPIVLFDVKFANEEYINVPFSIGNRSNNKNKILLGKEFLTKELDALIDISSDDIAKQNIQVDIPVSEANYDDGSNNFLPKSLKNNRSGAASTLGKIYQGTKGVTKGAINMFNTIGNGNQSIGSTITGIKNNWNNMINEINDYQKSDKYLIFKALNEEFMASGQPIKPFVNNPQVYKILDYIGTDYLEKNITADQANKEKVSTNQQNNQSVNQPNQQVNQQPDNLNLPNQQNSTDIIKSNTENIGSLIKEEPLQDNQGIFNKTKKDLNKKNKPILYLVLFDGSQAEKAKQVLAQNYPRFNTSFSGIMNDIKGTFLTDSTKTLAKTIVDELKNQNILSNFALVSGSKGSRKVIFLATAFETSYYIKFLNANTADYAGALLEGFNGEPNPSYQTGQFINNPIFGFKKYKKDQTIASSLPDKQIKEWIEANPSINSGYNIQAAFDAFVDGKTSKLENPTPNDSTDNDSIDSEFTNTNETPPIETPSFDTSTDNTKKIGDIPEPEPIPKDSPEDVPPKPKQPEPEDVKDKSKSSTYSRPKEDTTNLPRKMSFSFTPPVNAKRLSNGRYYWKDETGRVLEFEPQTSMLYDAHKVRREHIETKDGILITETNISKFVLDCLLDN